MKIQTAAVQTSRWSPGLVHPLGNTKVSLQRPPVIVEMIYDGPQRCTCRKNYKTTKRRNLIDLETLHNYYTPCLTWEGVKCLWAAGEIHAGRTVQETYKYLIMNFESRPLVFIPLHSFPASFLLVLSDVSLHHFLCFPQILSQQKQSNRRHQRVDVLGPSAERAALICRLNCWLLHCGVGRDVGEQI